MPPSLNPGSCSAQPNPSRPTSVGCHALGGIGLGKGTLPRPPPIPTRRAREVDEAGKPAVMGDVRAREVSGTWPDSRSARTCIENLLCLASSGPNLPIGSRRSLASVYVRVVIVRPGACRGTG